MNAIVILILIVLAGSLFMGFHRGIVKEVGSLCGMVIGLLVCRIFGSQATDAAASVLGVEPGALGFSLYTAAVVGRGVLFLLVWLGVYFLTRLLRSAIHAVRLGILDRVIGAVFCCVKWNVVLSLVLNLIHIVAPAAGMWSPASGKSLIDAWLAFAPWLFGAISDACA
ncbi:MAG: CvpA family protein [Muribaculaceae bacterium]|nr:CvpA family protein [Muribaculaceae bacterium]